MMWCGVRCGLGRKYKTDRKKMEIQKDIQVISCSFSDLINTYRTAIPNSNIAGQLFIPEYQRPYVWNEKQINKLLDDFIEYKTNLALAKKDNEVHIANFYLGNIILHQQDGLLKIIDGQQRITTMLLMLKIVNSRFKSGIEYSSSKSIENIKRNFAYLKSVHQNEVFDYINSEVLESIDTSKINVTIVITATEDLAYTFFETQNTGGVRLSGSDIIKAHHLRAINSNKLINHQARKWESIDREKVEDIIQTLTKVRFWDNRNWRQFPFYRDDRGLKSVLIEEFTDKTNHNGEDISYYYSAVKNDDGRKLQMHESQFKNLKQPLTDGNNTLDYINEYVQLHEALFNPIKKDHRVSEEFYELNDKLLHGEHGTLFLKELLQICIVAYVSRFGFYRLFEATLYLYRCVYSMRVASQRNVREDSIFKFVYEKQFIDNILEVYTVDELLNFLKRFKYEFNKENSEIGKAKEKHLQSLKSYFDGFDSIETYAKNPKEFDKTLIIAISKKIQINAGQ
jgi:uncharacterized protein with ParB-like and HNH nuclease domain